MRAAEHLPSSLMAGPLHAVQELAYADGLHLSYRVEIGPEVETVLGGPSVALRVNEIQAVARLQQMNKSAEFGKAVVQAGKDKVESVAGVVKDPVGTLKNLPQGASRFFGRVSNTIRKASEGEASGRTVVESALGVRRKKAELALELGVSPYTTDPVLQRELDLAARAMAGGALVVNVAGMAVDGGAGTALSAIGINQTLQRTLVESTPDELKERNRADLMALRVPEGDISAFLGNPCLSPWQSSFIVNLLKETGVEPTVLIRQAGNCLTEHDARYFVQLTRIYHYHDQNISPLASFQEENGILCALDGRGALIVAVAADFIQWTALLQRRAEEFQIRVSPEGPVRTLVLLTDGAVSPRATEELTRRGIQSFAHVLGPL